MPLSIYAEEIISHYEHPHNKGKLIDPSVMLHEYNPVCGDDLTIYCLIEENKLKDVKFDGEGCAISIGTASMLTDHVKNKLLSEIEDMNLDTIKTLIGMDPGSSRVKCATLALKALQGAIFLYKNKPKDKQQLQSF